jgi:uncharacterized protein
MVANFELKINMDRPTGMVRQSELFVRNVLLNLPNSLTFHNLHHTQYVVRAAETIGRASHLRKDQLEAVVIAAWFHDIGYSDGPKGHEERSASVAVRMLTRWGASSQLISDVSQSILATKLPQNPVTLVDMVLCDADLAHLASDNYEMYALRLQHELQYANDHVSVSELEWCRQNLSFLRQHYYFTDYGNIILGRRKQANINRLIRRVYAMRQPQFILNSIK